jgi:hypothetical protein
VRERLAAAKAAGERVDTDILYVALNPSGCGDAEREILRLVIAADPQPYTIGMVERQRAVDRAMHLKGRHKLTRERSPAEIVTFGNCASLINVLFESGLHPHSDGVRAALVGAAGSGNRAAVEALLAGGADPNAPGIVAHATSNVLAPKETPLEAARGQREMSAYLMSKGAR